MYRTAVVTPVAKCMHGRTDCRACSAPVVKIPPSGFAALLVNVYRAAQN